MPKERLNNREKEWGSDGQFSPFTLLILSSISTLRAFSKENKRKKGNSSSSSRG
jgi:hypothetical protein